MQFTDKDAVRHALPIAYVAFELGIPLNEDGKRCCPFHDDTHPSFRTWVDEWGTERWGCYPCGAKGDVFDLIQRMEGVGFTDSVLRASGLLDAMPPQWEGVISSEAKREFDRTSAEEIVKASQRNAVENLGWMCVAVGAVPTEAPLGYRQQVDEFFMRRWMIGFDDAGNTVIPHYSYTRELVAVKFRELGGGQRWAMPGSKLDGLYGGWLARASRNVLLCEGESDAWWASLQTDQVDILALPSGAGFLPQWAAVEADVYFLAFDADEAGRNATAAWREALRGRDVRVVEPPDGEDLRSWRPDLAQILDRVAL